MYKSGKYTIPVMMSVSGHKDERTFRDYVKLDKDELAEMVVIKRRWYVLIGFGHGK